MVKRYTPCAGDVVWLDFDPQAGHEHNKRRPAVVISPREYNALPFSLMICCPTTTQIKGYPWEVEITGTREPSVALADQIKNLDWKARKAEFIGKVTAEELEEIRGKAISLIRPDTE